MFEIFWLRHPEVPRSHQRDEEPALRDRRRSRKESKGSGVHHWCCTRDPHSTHSGLPSLTQGRLSLRLKDGFAQDDAGYYEREDTKENPWA